MDHQYHENKNQYVKLENLKNPRDQSGGTKKNKLLFIMFPGFGYPINGWDVLDIDENNKIIRTNFITELKKLGEVYFYSPSYNNLSYYDKKDKYNSLYDKNIDFTKDDFNIPSVCKKIYDDLGDFEGKFVLVSHSIGSYFMYWFQKKYYGKCLFAVNIDGSMIGPFPHTKDDKKYLDPKIKKYTKYTNEDIDKLKNKVFVNDPKAIKTLYNIAIYNIFDFKKVTQGAKKLKIPCISFFNFTISDDMKKRDIYVNVKRIKEIEYFSKNNEDYRTITFINKTHFPHLLKNDSRIIMLDEIKLMIEKWT